MMHVSRNVKQYKIWLRRFSVFVNLFSVHCALLIKVICIRFLLWHIWLSAEWQRDQGERCLSLPSLQTIPGAHPLSHLLNIGAVVT